MRRLKTALHHHAQSLPSLRPHSKFAIAVLRSAASIPNTRTSSASKESHRLGCPSKPSSPSRLPTQMVLLCRARRRADVEKSKKTSVSRAISVSLRISKRKSVTAPKRTLIAPSVRSQRRVTAQEAREANAQIYATVTKSAMAPRATKQALKVEKTLNLKFKEQEQQEIIAVTMKITRVKKETINEENEIERGASRRSPLEINTNFL